MSKVNYISLVPDPNPKLEALMAPGETPHMTLVVAAGKADEEIAADLTERMAHLLLEHQFGTRVSGVLSTAMFGPRHDKRVLILDSVNTKVVYNAVVEATRDVGLRNSYWRPHVTLGANLPPVLPSQWPPVLSFSTLRVKGGEYSADLHL